MASKSARLADEKYVSLTTFKKSGDAVSEPMWVAADGDDLVMMTGADSWKVKRLRRDSRVMLAPSDRAGTVSGTATPVGGTAEIVSDAEGVAAAVDAIKRKYGLVFHVLFFVRRMTTRSETRRVGLRITLT